MAAVLYPLHKTTKQKYHIRYRLATGFIFQNTTLSILIKLPLFVQFKKGNKVTPAHFRENCYPYVKFTVNGKITGSIGYVS